MILQSLSCIYIKEYETISAKKKKQKPKTKKLVIYNVHSIVIYNSNLNVHQLDDWIKNLCISTLQNTILP